MTVRGERADGRLHRLRHARQPRRLLDLRQHARLRGGADRQHDGPVDPEERGLLQRDRADRAAEGCCLNPPPNKSVAAGTHHPGTEVGEAIAKALEQVIPERCCPQIYKMGMPTVIFGTNPRTGQLFIDHSVDTFGAYCGAVKGQDGWGAMNVSFGNLIRATGEINESIFPVRHLARDYATDTGGPGQWRGCPGTLYVKQILAPAQVYTYVVGRKYPMPGIAGGKPGAPNELRLRAGTRARAAGRDHRVLRPARARRPLRVPLRRRRRLGRPARSASRRQVLDDVLDEYVSVEGARRDYGVVLTGSLEALDLAIDRVATDALRAAAPTATAECRAVGAGVTHRRTSRRRRRRVLRGEAAMRPTASASTSAARSPTWSWLVPTARSAGQEPDHAGGSIDRRARRHRACWPRRGARACGACWRDQRGRPRHHHRRQHDDRDERRGDRPDHHRRPSRRDRAAARIQGGHLGSGDRAAAGRSRRAGAASACRSG